MGPWETLRVPWPRDIPVVRQLAFKNVRTVPNRSSSRQERGITYRAGVYTWQQTSPRMVRENGEYV